MNWFRDKNGKFKQMKSISNFCLGFWLIKNIENFCLVSCKRCSNVWASRPVATEILFRVFDVTAAGTHQLDCSDILLGIFRNFILNCSFKGYE